MLEWRGGTVAETKLPALRIFCGIAFINTTFPSFAKFLPTAFEMSQQELRNAPLDAISALKFGPGDSHRLLVSSWDKSVYLYDIGSESTHLLLNSFEFRAPVLDVCFGSNDREAYVGGLDWDVRK